MIIAQISDLHIELGAGLPEREQAFADAVNAAVDHLNNLSAIPDVVIMSGDCTNNGAPAEYAYLHEILQRLSMPYYLIPGNHDNREHLLAAFGEQGTSALPGFVQYTVEGGPVRLIALDTNIPASGGGELCETRLRWLAERLAEQPERPTVIFMHHPPFATGWQPFDRIGLANREAFESIVAQYSNIERIVCGHTHTHTTRRFAGTIAMICPATGKNLLIDENQPDKVVVAVQPSLCLLHVWRDGIGLQTHTSVIGAHTQVEIFHDGVEWVG